MALTRTSCFFIWLLLINILVLFLILTNSSKLNLTNHVSLVNRSDEPSALHVSVGKTTSGYDIQTIRQTFQGHSIKSTSHGSVEQAWLNVQAERKHLLETKCELYPFLKKNLTRIVHDERRLLWPFLVDDKYHIIFGYVSKVGSTNWKSAFLVLQGKYQSVEDVPGALAHDPSLRKLSSYTPQEIEYRLQHYTKFVFVRDPFARVLSAYRSKFDERNMSFKRSFGRDIIARFRPNAAEPWEQRHNSEAEGVRFPEFVQAITSGGNRFADGHWNPIYQMILPCTVKFDFIGKLETADEDSENILKYIEVDHLIHFMKSHRNLSQSEDVFQQFYAQLSPGDIINLQRVYKPDFDLFGYDLLPKIKVLQDGERNTEAPIDSWFEKQSLRKQLLNDECRRHPSIRMNMTDVIRNKKELLWPYIVDDKYRILYGFISKVGSTHWKSAFLVLKGKFKRVEDVPGSRAHDPSLKKLSQYSPEEIDYRLENYATFMFVRDPLARVLSAYRNKLEENNKSYQRTIGRRIIKAYREHPSEMELDTGANVTFAEFVRFITDEKMANNMDGHWKPIYQMVLPCNIHYDYIGKLETGQEDSANILKHLKVDHLVHFKESTRNTSHSDEIFNKYYNTISKEYLHKLYETYAPDFKLFGYSMNEELLQRKNPLLN
ncbi:carbohydrate sulfotransferase 12-like isoform X2 [Lytechinus variegatus]|uniref:carbohydrate sulfotransferase 12-like isoform X2 n=1 Tax=Lytechinus variegatus TaxID=7654 RepID=UPI001BB1002B|nr:carbohydrate sulfotransferase 12-like isoform X2 [Lytechinus variegatus]